MFRPKYICILLLVISTVTFSQTPPNYSVSICTPQSKGYYFLNASSQALSATIAPSYNLILDHNGNLFYFKRFSTALKSTDFKLQANGIISYYSNNKFYLMDNAFTITDSVSCKNGVTTDTHDMQILENGHFLILGTEKIKRDLSKRKIFYPNRCAGSPNATITCGVIQELDENKNVVFEWHSKNYFQFMDIDSFFIYGPKHVEWNHFNAIELDTDGNILVSSRNFNEITKINRKDSSIIWRLGGKNNQFVFINDTDRFLGQHDIRRIDNGNLTIYDNGRANPLHPSSAKEYELDEKKLTATLKWKYQNKENDHSERGLGNVQKFSKGNTLVCFGRCALSPVIFTVLDVKGNKCFEMEFIDTLRSYRVFNYPDFNPNIKRPQIKKYIKNYVEILEAIGGTGNYLWSNGETSKSIEPKTPGIYSVYSALPDGGYLVSLPIIVYPRVKK